MKVVSGAAGRRTPWAALPARPRRDLRSTSKSGTSRASASLRHHCRSISSSSARLFSGRSFIASPLVVSSAGVVSTAGVFIPNFAASSQVSMSSVDPGGTVTGARSSPAISRNADSPPSSPDRRCADSAAASFAVLYTAAKGCRRCSPSTAMTPSALEFSGSSSSSFAVAASTRGMSQASTIV